MGIRFGRIKLPGMTPGYLFRFNPITGNVSTEFPMENDVDSLPGRDVFVNVDRTGKGKPGAFRYQGKFTQVPSDTGGGLRALFTTHAVTRGKLIKNGPIDPRKGKWEPTTYDTFTKSSKFRRGA